MQIFGIQNITSNSAEIIQEDIKHCIQVLRHKIGDEIFGVDGFGNGYSIQIQEIKKNSVQLNILKKISNWGEPNLQTHLVFSTLKNADRLEWMLEKSIELGVTHWHPVICKRTEKLGFPEERMKRIAWAAIKQCKRSKIPEMSKLQSWNDFIKNFDGKAYIAHCETQNLLKNDEILEKEECWLMIGPEGDFTSEEVQSALAKNAKEVSFGNLRMRSETAGVYFLSARHQFSLENNFK